MIDMKRSNLPNKRNDSNARLVLSKGLTRWPEKKDEKGEAFVEHLQHVCSIPASSLYDKVIDRIRHEYAASQNHVSLWQGAVEGKLMMGGGAASVLETGITLCQTWGVPRIPGSTIKGICRTYAAALNLSEELIQQIFGDNNPDIGIGRFIFHDAWWLPGSAPTPLVRDIVTPHHQQYYQTRGKVPPAETDEPVPSQQIAARGAFLFAVEGDADTVQFAMGLLEQALQWRGVGAKTAVGYGYFKEWDGKMSGSSTTQNTTAHTTEQSSRESTVPTPLDPKTYLSKNCEKDRGLAKMVNNVFGSNFSKDGITISQADMQDLMKKLYADRVVAWKDIRKKEQDKKALFLAYKAMFGKSE